jgi:hypothetical protein
MMLYLTMVDVVVVVIVDVDMVVQPLMEPVKKTLNHENFFYDVGIVVLKHVWRWIHCFQILLNVESLDFVENILVLVVPLHIRIHLMMGDVQQNIHHFHNLN